MFSEKEEQKTGKRNPKFGCFDEMLDFMRFTDGLPCAKRTFGILLVLGLLCSYIIYDFNSRKGYLVKVDNLKAISGFAERHLWKTRPRDSNRIITAQPLGSKEITPTRSMDTSKGRRIKEKNELLSSGDYASTDLDKKSSLQKTLDVQSVDRHDKTRADSKAEHELIPEVDSQGLPQEITWNSTENSEKHDVKRLPNAIIIGVKKGGTRALLEILKIHPSIKACNSEVHFFDRDQNYKRGLQWYKSQMPASVPGQITIEKSPAYFVTSKVPKRVHDMSKSVKLIVVVRDPTRRAISDYTQSLAKKPDNYPFETFAVKNLKKGIVNENWMKLKIGLYHIYLEKWLEYFPLDQIHFVSGEDLIKNPAKEVRLVEKFLNLKPFISDDNFFFNETKGFYCIVGKRTVRGIQTKPNCMGKSKGRTHPAVTGEVMKLLHRHFRPHNLKFYKMVKRDFGWP